MSLRIAFAEDEAVRRAGGARESENRTEPRVKRKYAPSSVTRLKSGAVCQFCEKEISPSAQGKGNRQRFCSTACRVNWWRSAPCWKCGAPRRPR